jgi:hypothetical protein
MADLDELRKALKRKLAGKPAIKATRKSLAARAATRMSGEVTSNVTIPDINHGAWGFIDQPYAPDFKPPKEKFYDFL